ncbi:MAG TPA: hypothetical protein VMH61_06470 [Candidatus Acidoferrales bacterium]|nr:hypothetical protein [Candidatus Acidoferrales bacterium]
MSAVKADPRARATRVVWTALLALWLVRAVASLVPTTALWGLGLLRFLAPLPGWGLWAAGLLALAPAVARRLARRVWPSLQRAGDRRAAHALAGLAAGALVLSLPDRTWMTGDFLIRQALAEGRGFVPNFSHSLPGELLLDGWLPRLAAPRLGVDPNLVTRGLEAAFAAILAAAAAGLAAEWTEESSARWTAAAIVIFGGYLATFTGLGKPTALMCVLTASTLLGATRLVRRGRSGALLGGSVGLALLTHRSALMLLPLWLFAMVRAARGREGGPRVRRSELAWALGPPVLAALLVFPLIAAIVLEFDLPMHFAPAAMRGTGGFLRGTLAPLRWLDSANMLLLEAPAVVPALALLLAPSAVAGEHRDDGCAGVLALSALPVFALIHPIQGIFRDLEVYAPAGLALSAWAASALGRALEARRIAGWLALALAVTLAVPSLQWLVHFNDRARGEARTRAFALESPRRDPEEIAQLWDLISYLAYRRGEWPAAREAMEHVVRREPDERALVMWAMTRSNTGDFAGAESVYSALATRDSADPVVWLGLGGAAMRAADSTTMRRAFARLDRYAPGSRERRLVQQTVRDFPEMWPPAQGRAAASPAQRRP